MKIAKHKEVWFVAGSQHLYGAETLKQVASNASELSNSLDANPKLPVRINYRQVVTSTEEITKVCNEANNHEHCIGVVVWMHTFSPAKMWINGLKTLSKPLAHLHTQFNREIPWGEIDMDFMNLNQSAHGDREFGHLLSRMRKTHKVIVGHWKSALVVDQLSTWMRAALAWNSWQSLKVARFGDNMRDVAVTEGDKVEAEIKFGFSVNGYGVGDLTKTVNMIDDKQATAQVEYYAEHYETKPEVLKSKSLIEAARIELGLRRFLETGNFGAFTNTFENLHGLHQLPGIAVQRLMSDGYGFGAEGDWKAAALLSAIKVMGEGINDGSSFMEDYTYHFQEERSMVLGAHMLEICPSIAAEKPRIEVHPLSIGGKSDPARLIFEVDPGPAVNVSLVDLGNRFRLLVNQVEVIKPEQPTPKLPVAKVIWEPEPSLEISAQSWLLAGGAHHTVFSKAVDINMLEDFAEMAGIELLVIDKSTRVRAFKNSIRWNEVYYQLYLNNL